MSSTKYFLILSADLHSIGTDKYVLSKSVRLITLFSYVHAYLKVIKTILKALTLV